MDNSQPSLFDEVPADPAPRRLSPSEEYDLAHPGAYAASVVEMPDWNPNTRRAYQLAGTGGGLSAALRGELSQDTIEQSFPADERVQDMSQVICGDCAQIIPCAHSNGRQTFGH